MHYMGLAVLIYSDYNHYKVWKSEGQSSMDYASIGSRVRQRRKTLKLSQVELARMVSVSASFIGHIERAEKTPSLDTMARLSAALNVPLDWLVLGIRNHCGEKECPLYHDLVDLVLSYGGGAER